MKRFLGLTFVLLLLVATSPLGGANAAAPKVGSKCTKLNQKIKVSQQSFLCSKSGKKLVWVKAKKPVVAPPKKVTPTPSKSPSPATANNSSQIISPEVSKPAAKATELPTAPTPAPTPAPSKSPSEVIVPTPSPGPAVSSEQTPSSTSAPSPSSQETPEPSPSPSPSTSAAPVSNVLETFPISLSSPTISGIKNGAVPSVGQILTCSGWKWDQEVPQTIISWIAYPSNTGSDIIDPKLYTTLSTVVAIGDSKLEISTSNIEKISGNYLYCFATAKTAGGLETASIAALLLGK